jgi:tRNA(Ile)-lysidine synthetase-like protein
LAGDYEVLANSIDEVWPKVIREAGPGYLAFQASSLDDIPAGLLRNIFRRGMETLRPNMRNLDFNSLQRAADFANAQKKPARRSLPGKVELCEGLFLQREKEVLYLAGFEADLPSQQWPQVDDSCVVGINQQISLNDQTSLSVLEMDSKNTIDLAGENSDPFTAWLDADITGDTFTVRAGRPGDRIKLFGMDEHSIKLSDLFINVKLPKRARAKWPLIFAGDEIAWVPGFRLAHWVRITENTKRVVRLTIKIK